MGPISGTVVYLITWWTVLFAVLPWGVRQPDQPHDFVGGAPVKANMKKKLIATTLISAVIWCVIAYLMHIKVVDFRSSAENNPYGW